MTDDQGKWTLGTDNPKIRTPNIDYLAEQGVYFNQAISPAPVCSAARATFMTGRMPSQHGVHDFLSEDFAIEGGWLAEETLLSESLQALGYRTGLFGKWHADTNGWKPVRGFDRWLSYDEREAPWINQYLHSGTVHFSRDGIAETYTGVQAHFLTQESIRFIDETDDRPFAIFLNYVEPHFPFEGLPERLVSHYRLIASEIVASGGSSSYARPLMHGAVITDHEERLSQYLAAVTLVDEQVGRLLDALQGRDLLENTLIVYTSDQGHLTGQYGLYGKGNASLPQNLYQESINIPLIVSGPASIVQAGQIRNEFVNLCDLNRTLLDLAGGETTTTTGQGISLKPLLEGRRIVNWRPYQYAEYGNARMIHDGRWKLVTYHPRFADSPPVENWYDLAHPLGEMRPSPPPSEAGQKTLRRALKTFFDTYETKENSGKRIWSRPRQNGMEPWRPPSTRN